MTEENIKNGHTALKYRFTSRELEVLELAQQGMKNQEIADSLKISTGTARNYLSSVYRKLNVGSRVEAIKKSVEFGLLTPVEPNIENEVDTIVRKMGREFLAKFTGLSSRELETLNLAQQGMQNQEIADSLEISAGTVRNHLSSIYKKLGVSNRVEAIKKSIELGLLEPE